MGNKNLTYSKGAKKSFVDGYFNKKFASNPTAVSNSETFIYDLANEHRQFFKPIFANESQYLPNTIKSGLNSDYSETLDVTSNLSNSRSQSISSQSLTIPPNKKSNNLLLKAVVLGAGLFLAYQIIKD